MNKQKTITDLLKIEEYRIFKRANDNSPVLRQFGDMINVLDSMIDILLDEVES